MSSFIIILTRKRELMVLCLFTVNNTWLFLMVPCVCLQCVIVVFSDHTHLFCNPLCSIISPIQNIWSFKRVLHYSDCNYFAASEMQERKHIQRGTVYFAIKHTFLKSPSITWWCVLNCQHSKQNAHVPFDLFVLNKIRQAVYFLTSPQCRHRLICFAFVTATFFYEQVKIWTLQAKLRKTFS